MKFDVWEFFETLPRKSKLLRLKSDENDVYFTRRPFHMYSKTYFNPSYNEEVGHDSSVGIANKYRLEGQGIESR